jgi:hypothetical protein
MLKEDCWEVLTALADHFNAEGMTEEAERFYRASLTFARENFGASSLLSGYSLLLLEDFFEKQCNYWQVRQLRTEAVRTYIANGAPELLFLTRLALRKASAKESKQATRRRLRQKTLSSVHDNLVQLNRKGISAETC